MPPLMFIVLPVTLKLCASVLRVARFTLPPPLLRARVLPEKLSAWISLLMEPSTSAVRKPALARFTPVPPLMFSVVPVRLRFCESVFRLARLTVPPPLLRANVLPARLRAWI